jgi:hypothetical protein
VNPLPLIQGALLYAALAWKLNQLIKAPRDLPLRMVTACFACAGIAYPFQLIYSGILGDVANARNLVILGLYGPLLLMVYALNCFFLFSAVDSRRARILAGWQAIPFVFAEIVLVISASNTPGTANLRDYTLPSVVVFQLTATLSLAYGLGAALVWALKYARAAEPRLRFGLRLTSLGLAAMVIGALFLALITILHNAAGAAPGWLPTVGRMFLLPGILVFIVGISYPSVVMRLVATRVWWRHLIAYHRLRPLWRTLNQAFPQDALNRVPANRWIDTVSLRGVHRRYYRRAIECRDGLVRISPYLSSGDERPVTLGTLARQLTEALRAHAEGEAVEPNAKPLAIPGADGLDADVRELVALSGALRTA